MADKLINSFWSLSFCWNSHISIFQIVQIQDMKPELCKILGCTMNIPNHFY